VRATRVCTLATVIACTLSATASAGAAPKGPTLVARATFPGVAQRQQWRVAFGAAIHELGLRVVARPDGASLIVEDPSRRLVRRRGHPVWVATKPCGRATITVSLVPGTGDLLAFARTVLPEAQQVSYLASTGHDDFYDALTSGHPTPREAILRYENVRDDEQHPSKHVFTVEREAMVADWSANGLHGWAIVRGSARRLRNDGVCRYDPTEDPLKTDGSVDHGLDPMVALYVLLGGRDA
jgi:hypothetical protein